MIKYARYKYIYTRINFGVVRFGMFSARRITRRIFQRNVVKMGIEPHIEINVTIRRTLGADISASCGQLRKSYIENEKS
jgi:predicted trehalose synthase